MTMYQNAQGGVERWIEWSSGAFSRSGYSPLTRCQKVSERLESQRRAGRLKYITSSMQKSLPVVCTATDGGECDVMLFTLRRREDVVPVMSKLLALREGVKGVPPLRL
jgi:altronate dehydratase